MAAAMALRLCCALLLLQLLLHSCAAVAIYDPDYAGEDLDGPKRIADDDEGAGVITVHAAKRKPPPGSRVSPPPPAPREPSPSGDSDCPQPRRKKRAAKASKPLPVREVVKKEKRSTSDYHCPESWKELDFSEVQEVECPENATGWFPFPPDCRKYLNCWNGRGFLQACAPATLFHPIRRECDYPKKVKCLPSCRSDPEESEEEGDIIGSPVDYVDPDHPRRPSPLIDVRMRKEKTPAGRSRRHAYNARLVSVNGIQCTMEGGTGLQAHPTDCTKFVNCWEWRPHIMSCSGGTLFSSRLNTCDHAHKVTECVGGKRLAPGVEPPPAEPAPAGLNRAGAGGAGGAGGGYYQFGNQGYQPPPRQVFLRPTAEPSGFADQVLPPPGGKGKSLYPSLQPLQPSQPSQEFGRGPSDIDRDVESIGSGGVIGPLPRPHPGPHPGHNEQWHRQHGVPMPTGDVPPGHSPAYHQHDYHHHHHHQQGHHYPPPPSGHQHGFHHQHQPGAYTPHSGYTPPPGRYSPTPSGYGTPSGGSTAPTQGGYGGYRRPGGDYPPQPGPDRQGGHSPHWHQGGGHRGTDHVPATTPSYDPPTTTCPPVEEEWQEGDEDDDFRQGDLDLRSAGSSNWLTVVERTKNTSMPQSGQMVRIRGGPTPLEGYVEVMGPGSKWGSVCDKPANWTVEEATIVCKMLGYERGAELAWQGRPRSATGVLDVHVESVHCSGKERSLMGCSMSTGDAGDGCNLETQAAGLRCYPNYVARCRPGEVPFRGSCYSIVIPRRDRRVEDVAFSQDEAIKHCKSQGGHLLDIGSQAENDFISEWLTTAHPELGSVLTSGVGVSVPGGDVWVWEDTRAPFQYNLWWPGPPSREHDRAKAPKVGERPLCILLKKDFPCDTWPGAQGRGAGRGRGGAGYGSWQGVRSCGAEYFFWHAEDCAIRQKSHPYVCERKADDVGCLGPRGTTYEGAANVSWNGLPCVAWDSPAAVSALHYRVSEEVRRKSLSGHNYCRNLGATGGNPEPWCFVDAGASGIKAERCDIPQCKENTGNSTVPDSDLGTERVTTPTPGLYEANGRPRPPATASASAGDSSFPPLSRPYPPVYLPRPRDQDDPLADPRGTASFTDRPWPTLPTSRPFVRATSAPASAPASSTPAWPDPFAGRGGGVETRAGIGNGRRGTPTPSRGRAYTPPPTTTARPAETLGPPEDPDPSWPVNYAPSFSHREVRPRPTPDGRDPPTPARGLQPPYGGAAQPGRATTPTPPVYPVYPSPRDREEYVPAQAREDEADYANVPDPIRMPAGGSGPGSGALGYGARPDPARGYGLPDDLAASAPRRPPVVTARPPAELYNYLLPGQSYAPYASDPSRPAARPSYSNLFGLLPALSPMELSYYPSEGDLPKRDPEARNDGEDPYGLFASSSESPRQQPEPGVSPEGQGRYPYPTAAYPFRGARPPGSSRPYSQVGYYPAPRTADRSGSEEGGSAQDSGGGDSGSDEEDGDRVSGRSGQRPAPPAPPQPMYNGHSGPGAGAAPSRQSRTAEDPAAASTTTSPTTDTAPPAATTIPPFSRPNVKEESEHVMKIPRPGEKPPALQVTTDKIFFIRAAVIHCGPQQFECSPNECIPSVWQCDGEPDCSNQMDERSCSDYLVEYKEVKAAKLEGHDVERWLHVDANTCARRCLDSTDFVCKSFSYKSSTKVCLLSRTNVVETGSLQRTNRTAWAYYERKSHSDPCNDPTRFLCANGKCVNATNSCNGRDDCGDRSDEAAGVCTAATIGYQLRLAGGKAKNEGRIEWGAVCDDGFGIREADVVCREAGYPEGAVEVLVSGVLPAPHKHLPFLVDELQCTGNETSLMGCEQAGWGVHDCLPEEIVGVRCATAAGLECQAADLSSPELRGGISWGAIMQLATKHCRQASRACPENQWQCESGECIPAKFLCDTAKDCKDGSDERRP
ncbi:Lysyl oxidase-like protein 2 [Frankliniella fusca]|uniref:Lysyl oxidase-like protein 2 n=1 Tax=Frankliniella fusca TaxID=407009 RepID=A0AAE1GTF9_9NEOP|nr:Lysyl oxidase-like protein 2 [Frankliniella fusca]